MRRARETAAPLAEALGVEPVVDEELAEFDRDAHFYIPLEELKAAGDERYLQIMRGEHDGEVDPQTFREVVAVAVERIIEARPGDTVAVVCHGGVINAWASHVLGLPDPLFFEPFYTSVNRFLASSRGHRSRGQPQRPRAPQRHPRLSRVASSGGPAPRAAPCRPGRRRGGRGPARRGCCA